MTKTIGRLACASGLAGLWALGVLAGPAGAEDLRMSWWGGDSRHIATQAALKACGAKHGVTVSPEFTGFSGYLEKLTTQMAGGTEPDIMQVNWPWLPLFSRDGKGFLDLDTVSDVIDLGQWDKSDLEASSVDGHLQGIPVSTTGRVFFFNTATLEKAGLTPPKTWDEFFADAKTVQDKLGKDYQLFNVGLDGARLIATLYAAQKTGKDMVDPETHQVAWSEQTLADGIRFYGKMVETGATSSAKAQAADGNAFLYEKRPWADGHIGGSYEWDSTYFKFADPLDAGQTLDSVPPPVFPDAKSDGIYRKASMIFSISRHTKHPKEAAEIVNCLLNEPEGIDALKDTRGVPASKAALARLETEHLLSPQVLKANGQVMAASGPALSPFNEHPEVMSIFQDTLEEYAYGMIDADEAAKEIIRQVNQVLGKYYSG